ncbi:transglycosylase SLT domain protein [Leptospira broomii serovar Hurstbridge str. 5399]|uniref:Transglycosylase SLT domain protein n=1 Tax=Leptospira broomii serovar Hurstbridge str. 5399 TaxID=1049789 RepID=T0GAA3_9LEPT|nr:lytic transglycosylase domain-containing protein [Leptospira broomii]EQA43744.1 transglycosylase SLT domain protein [Leptospira broomii serovar Hurstbridge str. 5399]
MNQPKIRKRHFFIAILPLLYQSLVAPIAGSLTENWILNKSRTETHSVKKFIQEHRPSISPSELEILTKTILLEAAKIDDLACGTYCSEGEKVGLLLGLIQVESEFSRKAKSKKNARGYMQVLPSTGAWIGSLEGLKVRDFNLFETEVNIHLGVSYLNHLLETQDGDIRKALLAYNAGPAAVKKWGGVRQYAEDVFSIQEEYLGFRK